MKKANRSIFQKLCLISAVSSALLLTGCMGGGGGGSSIAYDSPKPISSSGYYESSQSSISNLAAVDNRYSLYNGLSDISMNNIPVDENRNVLYACMVTNPDSRLSMTNLVLEPPLAWNMRASASEEEASDAASDSVSVYDTVEFRENPSVKLQLQQELMQMYETQERANTRCSVRAAASHADEVEGQTGISITILGKNRSCTLAKICTHAKIFIDENGDKGVSKASISKEKLNELADEFDKYIYPVMKENFGNDEGSDIFWSDVDNDSRLSIVFSPVVNNYRTSVSGIFDAASINSRYPRDVVSLSVKNDDTDFDKWFMDARETIAHEMQHIINFSAKGNRSESELWIDEGLAVCAEILYRTYRSNLGLSTYSLYYNGVHKDFPGNDARLYCYAYCMPEVAVQSFGMVVTNSDTELLAQYGQKGLFFYYLYEQYGKDVIRKLCRGTSGTGKFNKLITDRNLEQLIIDFNFATLYEKIRNVNLPDFPTNPYLSATPKHRFNTDMDLRFIKSTDGKYYEVSSKNFTIHNLGTLHKKVSLIGSRAGEQIAPNGGTVRFLMMQPKEMKSALSGGNSYSIKLNSSSGLPFIVNMLRMNN